MWKSQQHFGFGCGPVLDFGFLSSYISNQTSLIMLQAPIWGVWAGEFECSGFRCGTLLFSAFLLRAFFGVRSSWAIMGFQFNMEVPLLRVSGSEEVC